MTSFWENGQKPYFWAFYNIFTGMPKACLDFAQKPHFWSFLTIFGHAEGVQNFFSKIRLRYLNSIRPTSHHAKFQKNSMSGSGEKLITDGQTDGQGSIHRIQKQENMTGPPQNHYLKAWEQKLAKLDKPNPRNSQKRYFYVIFWPWKHP